MYLKTNYIVLIDSYKTNHEITPYKVKIKDITGDYYQMEFKTEKESERYVSTALNNYGGNLKVQKCSQ